MELPPTCSKQQMSRILARPWPGVCCSPRKDRHRFPHSQGEGGWLQMWLSLAQIHILMLFLPFKPPLSGKVGFVSLHSLEVLSFWAAFAQLAPQWAITFSRTVRSNVINSLEPSHCPGGIPFSSSSRYNCAYLPMSPPQGKNQPCTSHTSWGAEENFCHCWLPQNLLESIIGISWNLIKAQISGWFCISLSLLRNYLSRASLQWIDLSHFSKMLVEMCDLQETRWCFGLQAEEQMLFKYFTLPLERGTLVQSIHWILHCNGKFGDSITSNHSGLTGTDFWNSSPPTHKVYSWIKQYTSIELKAFTGGMLDLSPGGVTELTPRMHTQLQRFDNILWESCALSLPGQAGAGSEALQRSRAVKIKCCWGAGLSSGSRSENKDVSLQQQAGSLKLEQLLLFFSSGLFIPV